MNRAFRRTLVAVATTTLIACGSDNGTGPGPTGSGNSMSATIDGVAFAPPALAVQGSYTSGVLTIGGSVTSAGTTTLLSINLTNVTETGSYELSPSFAGQLATVTRTKGISGVSTWTTALSPGSGSVSITTLSSERAAGTFQFTAQQAPGTEATGQVSVTSGSFDITF